MERTVHHFIGDIPGAQLLGVRTGDLAVHSWDLARALGLDEQLDPALAASVWAGLAPVAPFLGQSGMFGEGQSGTLPEDASDQARLLDATGRRP